jgi:nucleoside-diphosphate-sugar epimerase
MKLRRHFESLGWTLRLLDVSSRGDRAVKKADLAVWNEKWVSTFADADAVILLAGDPRPEADWASIQRLNLDLTLNVYEAAVRQRARRVIFASSNWTMAGYRFADGPLPTDLTPFPVNPYGVSKLVGERLGRSFSERYGISAICFRIGYCQPGENRPGPHMNHGTWGQQMWLSNRDLCDGFEKAVTAPATVRFAVLNLMSDNPGMRWDIETTKRVIGYAPRDRHKVANKPARGERATQHAYAMLAAANAWLDETKA